MDFLNSPLALLACFAVLLVPIWLINKARENRKCKQCGKGRMQEVKTEPKGLVHSEWDSTNWGGTSTVVRTKVKYQCMHCKAFLVTEEPRR